MNVIKAKDKFKIFNSILQGDLQKMNKTITSIVKKKTISKYDIEHIIYSQVDSYLTPMIHNMFNHHSDLLSFVLLLSIQTKNQRREFFQSIIPLLRSQIIRNDLHLKLDNFDLQFLQYILNNNEYIGHISLFELSNVLKELYKFDISIYAFIRVIFYIIGRSTQQSDDIFEEFIIQFYDDFDDNILMSIIVNLIIHSDNEKLNIFLTYFPLHTLDTTFIFNTILQIITEYELAFDVIQQDIIIQMLNILINNNININNILQDERIQLMNF
jgi:hypothetical protein